MSESVAEVPGDGNPTVLGETDTSHELLQRLRELEVQWGLGDGATESQDHRAALAGAVGQPMATRH